MSKTFPQHCEYADRTQYTVVAHTNTTLPTSLLAPLGGIKSSNDDVGLLPCVRQRACMYVSVRHY